MCNKIDYVIELLNEFKIDILCIGEHWLSVDEISLIKIPGYQLADSFCRIKGHHGGSAIFVRDGLIFKKYIKVVNIPTINTFEISTIYIKNFNLICITFYTVPKKCKFEFQLLLSKLQEYLNSVYNFKINYNIVS